MCVYLFGSSIRPRTGDPRPGIADVKKHLKGFGGNHTYTYVAACGDQKWETDPNAPESLQATCVGSCHARFLLAVEEGAFLVRQLWTLLRSSLINISRGFQLLCHPTCACAVWCALLRGLYTYAAGISMRIEC